MASTSDRRDSRRLTGSTSPGRRLLLAGPAANFAIDSLKPDRRHQSCTHKITTLRSKLVALWVGQLCITRELLRIFTASAREMVGRMVGETWRRHYCRPLHRPAPSRDQAVAPGTKDP